MKTVVKPVDAQAIAEAAQIIRAGGLVGMPTETVYGLGADALNPQAVRSIFAAKDRPADNPLIVHVSSLEEIAPLVREIPEAATLLMEAFWPGPMTLILPKADCVSDAVSAGLDTVGIRMPASDAARALIRAAGTPIAAPSANRSGKPSPTTAQHVFEDMDGRIPMILDDGECEVGVESSVIDATGETPIILRPGGITPEMVKAVLGSCEVDEHVMSPLKEGELVRSPGMKHKHYSPEAKTVIYEGGAQQVIEAIAAHYDEAERMGEKPCILGFDEHDFGTRNKLSLGSEKEPREAAKRLFAALRELDERGETLALCEAVEPTGIGLAVMNRMGRAAGFDLRRV
ncbi:MAG: threonylcarbamoyl-AMP synthase [Clostridia bacterium]|nr:threonylcarbamoyl-AMP synthase [Clostridia bacterium]